MKSHTLRTLNLDADARGRLLVITSNEQKLEFRRRRCEFVGTARPFIDLEFLRTCCISTGYIALGSEA